MRKISLFLIAGSTLALAAPASAHRQWLLPSGTIFAGTNEWVAVDAGRPKVDLSYGIFNDEFKRLCFKQLS